MYRLVLSNRAEKAFRSIPSPYDKRIKESIIAIEQDPRAMGTVKLEYAPVAQYRYRVGDYRILFDINEESKTVEILDIRRRGERTYK